MDSLWTIDQLRTFVEVVRTGSFTRAAEALSLSQPAVSVQIRALERSTGVQLLERRPRRLLLTEAGRILLRYARRVIRQETEFTAELTDLKSLHGGILRLGAGATPSIFTLAALFAEYYQRWPAVELRVQIGRTAELVSNVHKDALDLAIVSSDPGREGLDCRPIYTERCVAIAATGHPLALRDSVDIAEIAGQPLVMLPAESGFRRFLQESLQSHQIELSAAMELASLEAIKEVVRSGVLLSIVPETAARGESASTGLTVLPITGAELTRRTVAIRRADKYVTRAMMAFYSPLSEHWGPPAGAGPPAGTGLPSEADTPSAVPPQQV